MSTRTMAGGPLWIVLAGVSAMGCSSSGSKRAGALTDDGCAGTSCLAASPDGGAADATDATDATDSAAAEAGDAADSGTSDASEGGADGGLVGLVNYSAPPTLPFYPMNAPIAEAATAHYLLGGTDLTSPVTNGSFALPIKDGKGFVEIVPTSATADLLTTGVIVDSAVFTPWVVPAVKASDLDAIYSANGLTRDPNKAQLIVNIFASIPNPKSGGYAALRGAVVHPPAHTQATLCDSDTGGVLSFVPQTSAGTGGAGVTIFVNVDMASAYPGDSFPIVYDIGGGTKSPMPPARLAKGVVSRIGILDQ